MKYVTELRAVKVNGQFIQPPTVPKGSHFDFRYLDRRRDVIVDLLAEVGRTERGENLDNFAVRVMKKLQSIATTVIGCWPGKLVNIHGGGRRKAIGVIALVVPGKGSDMHLVFARPQDFTAC